MKKELFIFGSCALGMVCAMILWNNVYIKPHDAWMMKTYGTNRPNFNQVHNYRLK